LWNGLDFTAIIKVHCCRPICTDAVLLPAVVGPEGANSAMAPSSLAIDSDPPSNEKNNMAY